MTQSAIVICYLWENEEAEAIMVVGVMHHGKDNRAWGKGMSYQYTG